MQYITFKHHSKSVTASRNQIVHSRSPMHMNFNKQTYTEPKTYTQNTRIKYYREIKERTGNVARPEIGECSKILVNIVPKFTRNKSSHSLASLLTCTREIKTKMTTGLNFKVKTVYGTT